MRNCINNQFQIFFTFCKNLTFGIKNFIEKDHNAKRILPKFEKKAVKPNDTISFDCLLHLNCEAVFAKKPKKY